MPAKAKAGRVERGRQTQKKTATPVFCRTTGDGFQKELMDSVSARPVGASDNLVNGKDIWSAHAAQQAAAARADNGADWATIPTWLLRNQWLLRLNPRVPLMLVMMSTVVTPEGEMVISERELASRLIWRYDVLERTLVEAEEHRLIERVFMTALPSELTWRLNWVWDTWVALHG